MSVTLERIGDYLHIHGDANGAALVRAAAEIIRLMKLAVAQAENGSITTETWVDYDPQILEALDAFDAISKGETP